MTGNIYVYRLKCLLRVKECLFWTLMFPIILGTLFYFTLSHAFTEQGLSDIPVAVVENSPLSNEYAEIMKSAVSDGASLFAVTVCTEEQAEKMLRGDQIKAYILADENTMIVKQSGLEETAVKIFMDQYGAQSSTIRNIAEQGGGSAPKEIMGSAAERQNYLARDVQNKTSSDYSVIYFYALIAMACLFGSMWGNVFITEMEADKSFLGARLQLIPVSKWKMVLGNFLASLTVHFGEMILLFLFLKGILQVNFGENTGLLILTIFIGCIASILLGAMITALSGLSENMTGSILAGITMLCSFLAGLMVADVKYLIQAHVPVLSWINPAALISDAFYSLYYYNTQERCLERVAVLMALSVLFAVITVIRLRRKQYASI